MTDVSTRADDADVRDRAGPPADGGSVESYETDDGVVLYDADNPLAWIEAARPVALDEAT